MPGGTSTPRRRFYDTAAWQRLRDRHIRLARQNGMTCQLCGTTIGPQDAVDIDHIVPLKEEPSRALDPSNLRPLHRR